jgi:hypothetical protein
MNLRERMLEDNQPRLRQLCIETDYLYKLLKSTQSDDKWEWSVYVTLSCLAEIFLEWKVFRDSKNCPLNKTGASDSALIGAAPDLLAACRLAIPILRDFADPYGGCGQKDAKEMQKYLEIAVAKAEGKSA